jgi:predicted RNA-binding protein with EMAP domain
MPDIRNILSVYFQATPVDTQEGTVWYNNAHQICVALSDKYNLPLSTVVGVVSALSPNNKWDRNILDAEQTIKAYCMGFDYPKVCTFGGNKDKAITILECEIDSSENICAILKGNKTIAFFRGIYTDGQCDEITVDGHAFNIWRGLYTSLNEVPAISDKLYKEVSNAYREAAETVNNLEGTKYSSAQIQAITWVTWRRMNGVVK